MAGHLVVIGGVAAGPKLAAKARQDDPELEITLVTAEGMISYAGCGTPYYLGGTFRDRDKLIVREVDDFGKKNRVTMLTEHRATSIDRAAKTVEVVDLKTDEVKTLEYTKLAICTGASSFVPPLEGLPAEGVFALRTVTDALAIDDYLNSQNGRRVVVVGGGYIGLELAEQFHQRQLEVTVVELAPQVMPRFDTTVALAVRRELESMGIEVLLETRVTGVEADHRGRVTGVRTSQGLLAADLVILAIGVRPNTQLAADAGLTLGRSGAIATDPTMRTSDPDIYAAGDCAECLDRVTGQPTWVPLGSTANKMGRTAAINICGGHDEFPGIVGTSLVRVGTLNVGGTGQTQAQLEAAGYQFDSVLIPAAERPTYMPGTGEVTLILHAEHGSRRVLGAQAYGTGAVDKRIDVIATALSAGMTVDDLAQLDLGYAPPFAPAMDVVITAANVLRHKLDGTTKSVMPEALRDELAEGTRIQLIDVRELDEWQQGRLAGAQLVPLGTLPDHCDNLEDCQIVVYCARGGRAASAFRVIRRAGHENVCYLEGGTTAWTGDLEK